MSEPSMRREDAGRAGTTVLDELHLAVCGHHVEGLGGFGKSGGEE
jgi:hypothetical protein